MMSSVTRLVIVPDPAAVKWPGPMAAPGAEPKKPPKVPNDVLTLPRSTWRYSTFQVQLPKIAPSAPNPAAHPNRVWLLFHAANPQVPGPVGIPSGPAVP